MTTTPKQIALLRSMRAGRDIPAKDKKYCTDEYLQTLTNERVSAAIVYFRGLPYITDGTRAIDGFYMFEGRVYCVKGGKARVLRIRGKRGTYLRARGMDFTLEPQHLMTFEQAQNLSHHYGFCVACGRTLTNPASVAKSMGPVCSKRFGAQPFSVIPDGVLV